MVGSPGHTLRTSSISRGSWRPDALSVQTGTSGQAVGSPGLTCLLSQKDQHGAPKAAGGPASEAAGSLCFLTLVDVTTKEEAVGPIFGWSLGA